MRDKDRIVELEKRLAQAEKRIAELESMQAPLLPPVIYPRPYQHTPFIVGNVHSA